jgi:O-antigen/teichoic acid export membrane protein
LGSLWTPDLVLASSLLLIVRLGTVAAHGYQCRSLLPVLWRRPFAPLSVPILKTLVRFGGWLTLSNIVGPFMVYMDRFYLGAIHSAEEVARYVTPYELATKLSLLPAAVLPVLFPLLVAGWVRPTEASGQLPVKTAAWMGLGCALPAAMLAALAPEIMRIWLAGSLAADSAVVLQILAGAVLVNCVAQVFFIQVQSTGRTDLIARIHIAELLGYAGLLWSLTDRFGIVGVALAWAIRVAVDAALFCQVAASGLSRSQRRMSWIILGATLAFGCALASLGWVESLVLRTLAVLPPLVLVWALRRKFIRLWSDQASSAVSSPVRHAAVNTK